MSDVRVIKVLPGHTGVFIGAISVEGVKGNIRVKHILYLDQWFMSRVWCHLKKMLTRKRYARG